MDGCCGCAGAGLGVKLGVTGTPWASVGCCGCTGALTGGVGVTAGLVNELSLEAGVKSAGALTSGASEEGVLLDDVVGCCGNGGVTGVFGFLKKSNSPIMELILRIIINYAYDYRTLGLCKQINEKICRCPSVFLRPFP